MARTRGTARKSATSGPTREDYAERKEAEHSSDENEGVNYSKMTAVELKKLLDARKIEGRSKLTKKETMIKVLELFDQNPDDKESIAALVAELSTPRKKTVSKSEVQEEGNDTPSSEEKTKKKTVSRTKKENSDEEKQEKPKRKPRTKKETTETSSSEEKSKEEEEEKSKRKPRTKKETTESSNEEKSSNEDTPKKKSLSKKQKERDEELEKAGINRADYPPGTRFVKSALGKFQVRYPKGYKEDESVQNEQSHTDPTPPVDYDSDATQEIPEDEIQAIAKTVTKTKKTASNPPSTTKSEPKEGKQEVPEEKEKQKEQFADLEDDPSMKDVLTLTRDILKRMKYLEREASENQEFKNSWVKMLTQLKGDFDNQLGLLGASIDE
jgi:hypothetical protein